MQIWIHDNKMKKIVALNNDIPDMMSYTNSSWHSYLYQATSTFDFTIPKFSNGELHEDLKLINDECFVSFYVNGSYQVFYIATLQEDDFNIQLTCNNTNLEYALEYANPFNSSSAQSIKWYLEHMDLLSFAAVEIGNNEIPDRKRTLTFDSQDTKMARLQSLMSNFDAEFEFKVELNRDGTYKRIVINIYQEADETHHGIGTDRKDVVLYYSNGLKGVQVTSDKTQMFNAGVFDGKDGVNLANVEFSEKNADGVEEFYSRKGDIFVYAPLSMQRYPATMRPDGQDNWIRKDFQTEYENVNDLKAYALRTLKKYAYPLVTYTASVQSGFVSHYTDLKLGDTIRIIDKNFVGGLALEARVSEMIISFDNPANNSFVFTNYRKLDNKPSSALQTRIEQAVESKLPYRIELATTGGVTFKNNEGETIIKPSLYKGNLPWTKDVTWRWALDGVVTVGMQYLARAENIDGTAVLTVSAYVGNNEVATTEITLTDVNDGDDGVGVESIDRYFTSSDQSDGVTIEGAEWSDKPPAPTEDGKYLWAYDEITYTDGTVTTTKPAAVGANFDVDAFRAEIAEDLKDVPNREEFENKIAEELANSKAEIGTQIETAKTQAESNAKEYADTINQETAKVAELANAAAGEIKADLVNVKNNLTSTSLVANNAQAAVDEAKQDLAEVAGDLNTAKQDLMSHAQQLQTQANAQTELTKRVTTVETTANGTKTTVSELTKTVAQNGKDITSVTNRTKTVEDDLANTKTTLTQVQTTADSTSKKTATLETGLNGLSAKFESLSVGGTNLIKRSTAQKGVRLGTGAGTFPDSKHELTDWIKIEPSTVYTLTTYEDVPEESMWYSMAWYSTNSADYSGWIDRPTGAAVAADLKGGKQYRAPENAKYAKVSYPTKYAKVKFERGNISTDYTQADEDIEQKVAEYKQNADQNYASLQSNLQTLDGTVKQNKSEFDQTAGQLKTTISAVEGKIPTNVSTRNLILKSNDLANPHKQNGANTTVTSTDDYFVIKSTGYTANAWGGMSWNMSISEVKAGEQFSILMPVYIDSSVSLDAGLSFVIKNHTLNLAAYSYDIPTDKKDQWFNVAITFKAYKNVVFDAYPFYICLVKNGLVRIKPPMLVRGNLIPSDYQPAFEDTKSDITKLNTTLTQTANGLEQLSTQVTSQGSTIISHTNSINSLATGLSAKVSQTDFNTLSGRVTTAENNITAKANELSSKITSVEGKIPTSVSQRNLVQGTSVAWSPFVNITRNNNWRYGLATINYGDKTGIYAGTTINIFVYLSADEIVLDSSINPQFFIQGEIIDKNGNATWTNWDKYHPFHNKWSTNLVSGNNYRIVKISSKVTNESYSNINGFKIEVRINGVRTGKFHHRALMVTTGDVFPDYWQPAPEDYDSKLATVQSEIKQTTDSIKASVQSLDNNTVKNSSLTINTDGVVIKAGKSTSDFANAVGSYFSVNQNAINLFSDKINVKGSMIVSGAITSDKIASKQINTAHLNGKIITADVISSNAVTADAIKAGAVTTDKMSANSINGDRITAGTLDAAKIKAGSITASQIASGTITSAQIKTGTISAANIAAGAITTDKIAANSINSSKIVSSGITANVIKGGVLQSLNGSTNFELNTGKLFYNNNNTGVFRVQNGASTMGLKFSNTPISVGGTSRILSRAILGGDRNETTLDDGKWDKGGFSGLVIETIKGAIPAVNEHADSLRAISDTIYFTHTYSADEPTGVSAHGWKMETYAPDSSYSGNIVLKPYGINYRQSDIVVGDIRLDNGDGSGYWMRATINTLKACFGHIINGGVSGNALNAIKSELNKISGT